MTKTILVAIALATTCGLQAQLKGFSLGAYAEYASPTGDFRISNKNGIGAGLNADIRLGRIGLTGSVGFLRFGGKPGVDENGHAKYSTINAVPVRAGLKYRLLPLVYIKMESGVAKFGGESAVILSPGLGIRVLGLDVQAKYESWLRNGSRGFWGLRAGYNF